MAENTGSPDTELLDLVRKFETADTNSTGARALAEKCRRYYDGDQTWTKAEEEAIRKRKQPVIRNNRVKPKIDFLVGMEIKNRTDPKAFPRTPQHELDAESATQAIRYALDKNKFPKIKTKVWENLCIEGEGGCDIYVKPQRDQMGNVSGYDIRIKRVHWDSMFVDPYSIEKDRSDATYLGQVKWVDLDVALMRWPDSKDVFEATETADRNDTRPQSQKVEWIDSTRKRIRLVDMWYYKDGDWWHCIFTRAGYIDAPRKSEYVNEDGETEHGVEFQAAFIDSNGDAYGPTKQWLDQQDEINYRRSKSLHLLSVRQTRVNKGAFQDTNKVRDELAKPDGMVVGNTNDPNDLQILPTGDMAAGQFQLLQEAKMELDAVGVNAAMAGQDERNMSGRALLARQESGMAELGPLFESVRDWEERVYRKVWNRIRQYWQKEMWIRVTDDDRNVRFVGLNREIPRWKFDLEKIHGELDDQKLQQLMQDPEKGPQIQQLMNDPMGKRPVKTNKLAALDVDIILAEVPDTVSLQAEQFDSLAQLAQGGVPIPPDVLIEASNLRDKQKLLDKMQGKDQEGIPAQVQQQIQAAMQEIQAAQEQIGKEKEALAKEKLALLQKQSQYVVEELDVRKIEANASVQEANAKAAAEIERARVEAVAAEGSQKLEAMLSQIMSALQQIGNQGVVPVQVNSKPKVIEITTPTGQTYRGQIQ